jgi:N-acetylhexosamine 1-kinase
MKNFFGDLLCRLRIYSDSRNGGALIITMVIAEYTTFSDQASVIASLFDIPSPIEVLDFPRKGNINQQTYWIKAGPPAHQSEYLLQLLNPEIFTQPRNVMDAMIACIRAQEDALADDFKDNSREWEILRLIPTKAGNSYLELANPEGSKCWRLMAYIKNTNTFKSLREIPDERSRLFIAEEVGRGLAIFGALTACMDPSKILSPLPGYRDTALYYNQLLSVLEGHSTSEEAAAYLPEDAILRHSTKPLYYTHLKLEEYQRRLSDPQLRRCIDIAIEHKSYAMTLTLGLKAGKLRRTVIHGDTKLENFLFSHTTGKIKALVDLDTIMPHTWLSDWGDMIRSLTNIAGERETNPDNIQIDLEVYQAAAKGYLAEAHPDARQEVELMADAPQIMALELGVRFLADYLRGDNYFAIGPQDPPELNKTRAMVQFCVFEKLRQNGDFMKKCISQLCESS